jgi:hypothetical protein
MWPGMVEQEKKGIGDLLKEARYYISVTKLHV